MTSTKAPHAGHATRRALLGAAALAPAAALPALAAPEEADAALLALERRLRAADDRSTRRQREMEAAGESPSPYDPVIRASVEEAHACLAEVGRLPALTLAGLLVKARIVRDEVTMGSTGYGEELAEGLVVDLERLAREPAA